MEWCLRAVVLRGGRLEVRETADPVPGQGELLLKTLARRSAPLTSISWTTPSSAIDDPTGRSLYDADRDIVHGSRVRGRGDRPRARVQRPVPDRFAGDVDADPVGRRRRGRVRIIGQHPEAQGSFGELLVVPRRRPRSSRVASRATPSPSSTPSRSASSMSRSRSSRGSADRHRRGRHRPVRGRRPVRPGIEPIIVSDFKAERRDLAAASFGAHVFVDPAEQSVFDVFREVRAERKMGGAAVVFECVGAPRAHRQNRRRRSSAPGSIAQAAGTPGTRSTSPRPPVTG